jgi:DNA primase
VRWLEDLVSFAQECLDDREREALYLRGVSEDQIERYRIGYLDRELPDADYPQRFTDWWEKHRSQLDDSLVLPLTTPLGMVGGFQLRHVQQSRRGYMDYLSIKDEACLFGLAQAMPAVWASESIWLVEGAFDLFPVERHLPNTVATLHAGINGTLWRVLRRLVKQISLAYDGDSAGREASWGIAKGDKAKGFDVKVIKLPRVPIRGTLKSTKDPNELWEAWGDQRLGVFLTQHLDLFQQETLTNARS